MAFGRTFDVSALTRQAKRLRGLSSGAQQRVVTRTVATLRRRLATETRRYVSEEYGIGVRELGKRITTEARKDSVIVYGTTARIPLIKFGGRYDGRNTPGATAEIIRGQRKTYKSAFFSRGKKNVVARAINRATGKRYGRLPVQVLRGPNPESMVLGGGAPATGQTPAVRAAQLAGEVFASEVNRLIDVELRS